MEHYHQYGAMSQAQRDSAVKAGYSHLVDKGDKAFSSGDYLVEATAHREAIELTAKAGYTHFDPASNHAYKYNNCFVHRSNEGNSILAPHGYQMIDLVSSRSYSTSNAQTVSTISKILMG